MFRSRAVAAGLLLALGAGTPAALATIFTTSQLTGSNWQTLYVQGFSPSVTPSPNPGAAAGDTVDLTQFQFFKSGTPDSASNIQLAILNSLYPSSPTVNALTTAAGSFVGLSNNTIASTAALNTGDPITFTFNNLPLTYGNDYAALFVNVGPDLGGGVHALTPALVSALAANYADVGGGDFHPTTNYGTESQFQYATSNFISASGFFNAFSYAGDSVFSATLSTVPEPATLALLGLFGVAALTRRRRV